MSTMSPLSSSTFSVHRGELTQSVLEHLVSDKLLAVVVPDFANKEVVDKTRKVYGKKPLEEYRYFDQADQKYKSRGVKRYGLPYNTTYANETEALESYYAQVPNLMWNIRQEFLPCLHPIDHLRLLLDEIWPQGAGVAAHNGKKNFVGIYREVESKDSSPGEIAHFDSLPPHRGTVTHQLAANIYIDLPHEGGELFLWPVPPVKHEELEVYQNSSDFRSVIASPPIKIKPEKGMLVLFNTRKPHAVAGFSHSRRSSLQCFVGVEKDSRMLLWN